ncbi:ethylmalonyl-CoA decarboxylase isoform X1 [Denticeps clupeoides]|nr:ethylmalonyl-CoA decarboxylase isoform X1 [Denticeps clupeoides]
MAWGQNCSIDVVSDCHRSHCCCCQRGPEGPCFPGTHFTATPLLLAGWWRTERDLDSSFRFRSSPCADTAVLKDEGLVPSPALGMALCSAGRRFLKDNPNSASKLRAWARARAVYTGADGYHAEEIKEKLRAFPGGSLDLVKRESGIAVMTVNNPTRRNAFSGTMMLDLEERVTELEMWKEGKGLIVQGAAGTFCSGSDLNAVRAISNPQDGMQMCMFMQNSLTRLLRLPLISVAVVEGRALGGGAELTTACDFRLMAPDSVIQFVHKHMGLVPGWGGAARLVRIVGSQSALKLLAGAKKVDAELGAAIGLSDGVLECPADGGVLPQAEQWLSRYVAGPADVVRAAKEVVVSGRERHLEEALRTEKDVFGTVWGGPANTAALAGKSKHK